jgi:hypothetical protein
MDNMLDTKSLLRDGKRLPAKTRIFSMRLTNEEYLTLENHAWTQGKTLGDWAREALLCEAQIGPPKNLEQHVFTELVGVQLLLMNALAPLLRGEHFTQDQLESLWKNVQVTKTRKAQELLSKRTNGEEK